MAYMHERDQQARHRQTHLAIGRAIRGCQAGHRVLFAGASQWVDKLAEVHSSGRL
jgi:hypothetical protein